MRRMFLPLLLALSAGLAGAAPEDAESGSWDFVASLDGSPIGTHRFRVGGTAQAREVQSDAQFKVRLLGIPVYRYEHHARERWQGDCLRTLASDTDDDGKPIHVDRQFDDKGEGCTMSFAYWNPRLVEQKRLVDPQTGEADAVRIERLPDAQVDVRGASVVAQGWRLVTKQQRITVWYEAGRWIALDAEVKGGRQLRYRLK